MLSLISLLTAPQILPYFVVVDAAISLASTIVALTPTQADDNVLDRVKNVWNVVKGVAGK